MEKLRGIYEDASQEDDFGNGRFVRKIIEEAQENLASRVFENAEAELTDDFITTIEASDIPAYHSVRKQKRRPLGFCA